MSETLDRGAAWTPPLLGRPPPPTAAALEAIETEVRREAQARGYTEGHAIGLRQAREEMAPLLDRLHGLIAALEQPFAVVDAEVERSLLDLACAVAADLFTETVAEDRQRLRPLLASGLAALGESRSAVTLQLHPQDLEELRSFVDDTQLGARLQADPRLARGDAWVNQEPTRVDLRLATRLARIRAGLEGEAA
ncbi:MAG TPA: FliH/SctL family protein [Nevskiaceae bacterium]|nr:FliH/SctL family protein [Nevskiaceae bacterium]